ncbi:MAG: NAD-glutamate dehydrogenase, partial [Actinomycetes bacterium]|nr:NAD-glutamate dehydrogenase [Actinomycetes bacterium]
MRTTLDDSKDELLARAATTGASRKGASGPPGTSVEAFLRSYYRHVAPEDILDRSEDDLFGAAMSQYRMATHRPQGTANIRVHTPTVGEQGWSADSHTVVEVVTD